DEHATHSMTRFAAITYVNICGFLPGLYGDFSRPIVRGRRIKGRRVVIVRRRARVEAEHALTTGGDEIDAGCETIDAIDAAIIGRAFKGARERVTVCLHLKRAHADRVNVDGDERFAVRARDTAGDDAAFVESDRDRIAGLIVSALAALKL